MTAVVTSTLPGRGQIHVWVCRGETPDSRAVACADSGAVTAEVVWHRGEIRGWRPLVFACASCDAVVLFGRGML